MELGQELEVEEFFPPRFWGLDPVFSAKVKLNIGDVLTLAPYPEFPGECPKPGFQRATETMLWYFVQVYTALVIIRFSVCM